MNSFRLSRNGVIKILSILAVLLSQPAFAGTRDTGGGSGIQVGGRLIVLDLVEAGLENTAAIPAIQPDPEIVAALEKNLNLPEPEKSQVLQPLARKLTEVEKGTSHIAGLFMASAFGFYTFNVVSYKLTAVDDIDSAIGEPHIQLAVRKGPAIFISQPNWRQLDEVNRVALLMHEIIYAFQPLPTGCTTTTSYGLFSHGDTIDCSNAEIDAILATSSKARYMNAYFFRPNWQLTWSRDLNREMKASDGSRYNNLAGWLNESLPSHVSRMRMNAAGDGMDPVFSSLQILGYESKKAILKRNSSTHDLARICMNGELPIADRQRPGWDGDLLGYTLYRQMLASRRPRTTEESLSLNYAMDVVDIVDIYSAAEPGSVAVISIQEIRSECIAELRKLQKKYFY